MWILSDIRGRIYNSFAGGIIVQLCIHNHANKYDGLNHLHLKVIPFPLSSSAASLYLVHYLVQRHDISHIS